jgi:hypothetical protein
MIAIAAAIILKEVNKAPNSTPERLSKNPMVDMETIK